MERLTAQPAQIKNLHDYDSREAEELFLAIGECIDLDESKDSSIAIKRGINQELDDLREKYSALDSVLEHQGAKLARAVGPQSAAEALIIEYFP